MVVVSNSTPLICLARIDNLTLLKSIFKEIAIPNAVYEEVYKKGKTREQFKTLNEADWIKIVEIKNQFAVNFLLDELDMGESETIVLAEELKADWVLMDERLGRRKLTYLGLNKIGTLGVLLKAKEMNLIKSIKPLLNKLRDSGFRFSEKLFNEILKNAGES